MKKYIICIFIIALIGFGGWHWLHNKYPSDNEIRHSIVGIWVMNGTKTLEYKIDGSYLLISSKRTNEGTWYIKNGFVITASTNALEQEEYHDKIISIDRSAIVMLHTSQQSTNFISAHKK
jgi:hypothetical protein